MSINEEMARQTNQHNAETEVDRLRARIAEACSKLIDASQERDNLKATLSIHMECFHNVKRERDRLLEERDALRAVVQHAANELDVAQCESNFEIVADIEQALRAALGKGDE